MVEQTKSTISRRHFLNNSVKAVLGTSLAVGFPAIVPATVFGKRAPSNRINIGAIGTGRISRIHDLPGVWQHDYAQVIAVCDFDKKRAQEGKELVNEYYTKRDGKPYDGVRVYHDYRELLKNKDVDAVIISTPDHWHAKIGVDAARAKKHIYMQKPASLTIAEGRMMSDIIGSSGVKFQIGSQQRSSEQFRYAAELVRNGRIGQLQTVFVGLPGDPAGGEEKEMPVPAGLDYDMWLGSTPKVHYTEDRVHPQNGYGRPGWLRCEQFGAGMITGWGAHHVDSAHWGMGMERSGPIEVWGTAQFPTSGLWDVHGIFKTEALYANGVRMVVSNEIPNGVKFVGSEGWIFVSRGDYQATSSDPGAGSTQAKKLDASDPRIMQSVIGPNEFHLPVSKEHHGNWLDAIRDNKTPIAPVEEAHRSCSACLLHHIAMKLKRKVYWDPAKEQFKNDDEANKMVSRVQREPYAIKKT
ncbi:Gfo/Idh/MocA family oxidoreductase [Segetibacter sp. 3557_3]|uniref:Gfo/Idh/MocA family protein n=1 Tax=Segetibacter sp. 3557_3 TaxID=2547429 RepID=UPI001058DAA8|nr:Gfo/Idh/MocA family oxidoreductase [Segetibacter sp. 3557_3]TDH26994.1 Gfo/Idh/MocA family oxidoreductase [Segetibacter sp. 3557_3]